MEKKQIVESIKKLKTGKKRNFAQKVDLIILLKNLDLKKTEQQQDFFITLNHEIGKKVRVCGMVGPELKDQASEVLDKFYTEDMFVEFKDKKAAKKLAAEYDYFIAQANLMGKVAGAFGRVFGPRGKMPNPKSGCVVPPKANLKALYEKLQTTIRVMVKTQTVVQVTVGNEGMTEEDLADNITTVVNQVVNHMPGHENNLKKILVKLTMGKPEEIKY